MKVWSSRQTHIALSSGEAEYYAAVKGGAEGLYMQGLCSDLGIEVEVRLHTDSSACKGMCDRNGLGKLRHLDLQYLWLQEMVRAGRFRMKKIPGALNPADLLTKPLSFPEIAIKLEAMGMHFASGRSESVDQI